VLPQENRQQVSRFVATHADTDVQPIEAAWGLATENGRQILPGTAARMDGFYYACLHKRTTSQA